MMVEEKPLSPLMKNLMNLHASEQPKYSTHSEDAPCDHLFLELWGNDFVCYDCATRKSSPKFTNDEVCQKEHEWRFRLGDNDDSLPVDGIDRGVSIQFLVDFCNAFNLWKVTTRNVRRHYILPMTSNLRCRFVDIPDVKNSGVVGKAVTFVSHSWGANFGDLVAALSDGADLTRIVWLDIFAVRQWPTSKPDHDFEAVIRQCSSFLVLCPSLSEVEKATKRQLLSHQIPSEMQSQIPFFRLWCLWEIFSAAKSEGVNIVMKGGSCEAVNSPDSLTTTYRFQSNERMLRNILATVDANDATATNPFDRLRMLSQIDSLEGGLIGFNAVIRGAMTGAEATCSSPVLQCAACGDAAAVETVLRAPERFVHSVASGGFSALLEAMLDARPDLIECKRVNGSTALMYAATGGRKACLQVLLKRGANVNVGRKDGVTALMSAAFAGHVDCVEALICHGADSHAVDRAGRSVLAYAELSGNAACIDIFRRLD